MRIAILLFFLLTFSVLSAQDSTKIQTKVIEKEKPKSELNLGGGLGVSFNFFRIYNSTSHSSINYNPSFNFSVFGKGKVVGFSTGIEYLLSRTNISELNWDLVNYTSITNVHQLSIPIKLALKTRGKTAFYSEIGIRPTLYFGGSYSRTNNNTGESYSGKYNRRQIRVVATNIIGVRTKFNEGSNIILGFTNEWVIEGGYYIIGFKAIF